MTTLLDEDDGGLGLGAGNSLRELINFTNSRDIADTIVFDPALYGGLITLGGTTLPTLTESTIIQGPGASLMTISGSSLSRIFDVANNVTAELSGLTIRDAINGAVFNDGVLTISDSCTDRKSGWFWRRCFQ